MSERAYYSMVLDQPADEVWQLVRDFNSYPLWVNGVEDSRIEDDLAATTVGSVRNFSLGGSRIRQRLVAHSDLDRCFSYQSCSPMSIDDSGTTRAMSSYVGTLRLRPISEGDRCLAEWSSRYECPAADTAFWADWWQQMLPSWLSSLRENLPT